MGHLFYMYSLRWRCRRRGNMLRWPPLLDVKQQVVGPAQVGVLLFVEEIAMQMPITPKPLGLLSVSSKVDVLQVNGLARAHSISSGLPMHSLRKRLLFPFLLFHHHPSVPSGQSLLPATPVSTSYALHLLVQIVLILRSPIEAQCDLVMTRLRRIVPDG